MKITKAIKGFLLKLFCWLGFHNTIEVNLCESEEKFLICRRCRIRIDL